MNTQTLKLNRIVRGQLMSMFSLFVVGLLGAFICRFLTSWIAPNLGIDRRIPIFGVKFGLFEILAAIHTSVFLYFTPVCIYRSITNLEFSRDTIASLRNIGAWFLTMSLMSRILYGSLGAFGEITFYSGLGSLLYCWLYFLFAYRKAKYYCKERGWELSYQESPVGVFWAYPPSAVIPILVPIYKSYIYANEQPVDSE